MTICHLIGVYRLKYVHPSFYLYYILLPSTPNLWIRIFGKGGNSRHPHLWNRKLCWHQHRRNRSLVHIRQVRPAIHGSPLGWSSHFGMFSNVGHDKLRLQRGFSNHPVVDIACCGCLVSDHWSDCEIYVAKRYTATDARDGIRSFDDL